MKPYLPLVFMVLSTIHMSRAEHPPGGPPGAPMPPLCKISGVGSFNCDEPDQCPSDTTCEELDFPGKTALPVALESKLKVSACRPKMECTADPTVCPQGSTCCTGLMGAKHCLVDCHLKPAKGCVDQLKEVCTMFGLPPDNFPLCSEKMGPPKSGASHISWTAVTSFVFIVLCYLSTLICAAE